MRWQPGAGPGSRRTAIRNRLKRWLGHRLARDARLRRIILNEIFTYHAAPDILMRVPFEDHAIFVDPRDDRIASTLISGRPWQRDHLERAIAVLRQNGRLARGGVFLDVGANIGALTLYAHLSGAFSRAVALEPAPANRAILARNLTENGLADRTVVLPVAASAMPQTAELNLDTKNLGAHSLEPGFSMSADETVTVRADRLDTLLRECSISAQEIGLAKIDVEGHEFAVLEGAPDLLAAAPPLMIEIVFDDIADRDRLTALLGAAYRFCLDLDAPAGTAPIQLADFQPTALQHELLIF